MRNVKAVIVGELQSGKSSLIHTLQSREFPTEDSLKSVSGVPVETLCLVNFDGEPIQLSLWDTAGNSDWNRLRPLCYPPDIFLICIDISDVIEYGEKWAAEVRHHMPETEILLIGTKSDLRYQIGYDLCKIDMPLLSLQELNQLAIDIRAAMYIEISAKYMDQNQINDVLSTIVRCEFKSNILYRRYNGIKFPQKNHHHKKTNKYQNDISPSGYRLVVCGYINGLEHNLAIPKEVTFLIHSYYTVPKVLYYDHVGTNYTNSTNYKSEFFNSSKETKRNYYIMFWMDLIAIILHNVLFLVFSIELFVTSNGDILSIFAIIFSCMEVFIIIVGYYLLFHPNTEYYTQSMVKMHLAMEFIVNLPMIIIQMVYLLENEATLIPSFYVSISTYFMYGIYKCCVSGCIWSHKTDLRYETEYPDCIFAHCVTWLIAMLSMFIIGIIFMVKNIKDYVAISIFVLSVISCLVIAFSCTIHMRIQMVYPPMGPF